MLTSTIDETAALFRADPAKARTQPSVTATLVNGHARLSAGPFNWDADLPPAIGGGNLAPSPTAYLLGALAGCGVVFLRDTLAPLFEVELDDVHATASASADTRGLLGMDGIAPDLADIRIAIEIATSSPAERVDAMLAAWRQRCPIYLALSSPNRVEVTTNVIAEAARQP